MEIIQSEIQKINLHLPLKSTLVVIGYFDGFHSSHQKLLNIAQKWALKENLKLVLVTFNQKVADYFRHQNNDLISPEVKTQLLQTNYQIDYLIELKVDENLVNTSKQKFLHFLEKNLSTKMVVEGQDFCFAAQCTGKIADLKKQFGVDQVVVLKRKKAVSATKIRHWLAQGKILKITFWLKRRLELTIKVAESKNGNVYQLQYPKTKIKAGIYLAINENNQEISFQIDDEQNFVLLEDPDKILQTAGVYQLKFKKFSRAKK